MPLRASTDGTPAVTTLQAPRTCNHAQLSGNCGRTVGLRRSAHNPESYLRRSDDPGRGLGFRYRADGVLPLDVLPNILDAVAQRLNLILRIDSRTYLKIPRKLCRSLLGRIVAHDFDVACRLPGIHQLYRIACVLSATRRAFRAVRLFAPSQPSATRSSWFVWLRLSRFGAS